MMIIAIQYFPSYLARLVGVQSKCKGNNYFKIVECRPTCRGNHIAK